MRRRVQIGLLVVLPLTACALNGTTGPSLVGSWAPQSAELGGQVLPIESFRGATLHLTKETYEFAGDSGSYSLLAVGPPAQIDILGRAGPNAGRTIPAIYRLIGDQLNITYQLGSGERPSEFASPTGSQVLLIRYKRVP